MELGVFVSALIGLINTLFLKEVSAAVCYARLYTYGTYYSVYCSTSCCGYTYYRYCCQEYEVNVGGIVGGIICFIIVVVVVIVIIVCIKKHQAARRTVVTTSAAQPSVTVVNNSNQQQMGGYGPQPVYPPQPMYGPQPGYGQQQQQQQTVLFT